MYLNNLVPRILDPLSLLRKNMPTDGQRETASTHPYARVRSISTETELSGSPTGAQGFSSLMRTPYALG